jgi:hypothetical protein
MANNLTFKKPIDQPKPAGGFATAADLRSLADRVASLEELERHRAEKNLAAVRKWRAKQKRKSGIHEEVD